MQHCVQRRGLQIGLLQCCPLQGSSVRARQTAKSTEQPGKSRLSAKPAQRRQNAAAVSPLAASQGVHIVYNYSSNIYGLDVRLSATPSYLFKLRTSARLLRSADAHADCPTNTNCVGYLRLLCGCIHCLERFSVAVPTVWNALSSTVRLCDSLSTFKHKLKSQHFTVAYT